MSEVAERNDTGKWIALKLFPHEKRSQRIADWIMSSQDITYEQRMKFLKTFFPDTHTLAQQLQADNVKCIEKPRCLYFQTEAFKDFARKITADIDVNVDDEAGWRDDIVFLCHGDDGAAYINRVMSTHKLRINYQEVSSKES